MDDMVPGVGYDVSGLRHLGQPHRLTSIGGSNRVISLA